MARFSDNTAMPPCPRQSTVSKRPGCHGGSGQSRLGDRRIANLRWVDWFNKHRLFGSIGHIPPAEAEANYYAARETIDMVA